MEPNDDRIIELTPEEAELKRQKIDQYTKKKFNVFVFSTFLTLFVVVALGGVGYLLDLQKGDGNHHYLALGVVVAYPLTQYILYRKYKPKKSSAA